MNEQPGSFNRETATMEMLEIKKTVSKMKKSSGGLISSWLIDI